MISILAHIFLNYLQLMNHQNVQEEKSRTNARLTSFQPELFF